MVNLNTTNSHKVRGYICLILAAVLWGGAFVFQKHAASQLDAFSFNCIRFSLAIFALLFLRLLPSELFAPHKEDVPKKRKAHHRSLFIGTGSGFFMFLGINLQQWGLQYTTAGKSGFLTALYILLVPIFGLFLGKRCKKEVWLGAIITMLGVYFLTAVSGDTINAESQFNKGDILTLMCSVAWACEIIWLGHFARYSSGLNIAIIQTIVVALLSAIVMLILSVTSPETYHLPNWEAIWSVKYAILYVSFVSTALAYTFQILGQRYVPPENAALVFSTEAVFALITGIIFLGEHITLMLFIGCALIFCGIVLAQLQGKMFSRS